MSQAQKQIFGLLGYPVKHSLSPLMHNAAFKALKINAEYRLFEENPDQLESFLSTLLEKNIHGLNVTVPYKEKVLDFVSLDDKAPYLKKIRAINTIVNIDGVWKGFNTDIPGFARDLKEGFNPFKKRAALLGAGGAAKAVAFVLASSGVKELAIFDIDEEKTQKLAMVIESLFPGFPICGVKNIAELDIRNKDLLVNATPIGLETKAPSLVKEDLLHKNLFVYDLIYNPAQTTLLKLAEESGAKTKNGLGMLLYQGALSFEYFTAKIAPLETMRRALQEGVK